MQKTVAQVQKKFYKPILDNVAQGLACYAKESETYEFKTSLDVGGLEPEVSSVQELSIKHRSILLFPVPRSFLWGLCPGR